MGLFSSLFGKKPVVEKDDVSGTFIAYYKGKEGVIGEGLTENEAKENLLRDIKLAESLSKKSKEGKSYTTHNRRVAHS